MKRIGLIATFCLMALTMLLIVAFRTPARESATYAEPKEFPITMCGSSFLAALQVNTPVTLMDGLGDLHHRITTKDSAAQKFFDQGLRLVYAFNHVEALRAFREASRLDPASAMTWWGQALTLGPNINDWNPRDREAMALEAIKKAKELSAKGTQKEKDFILAMATRYDGKAHTNRDTLNIAYRTAMEKLSKKYPADAEAMVLYADAIMTSMPWDYWNKDGSPKYQTSSARAALELAMKKYPRHPGAHHMYIHLVEASAKPDDARGSAEFLENAMPSAGHIVHMPSHIYARIGEFERSNNSNRKAIIADEAFLSRSNDQGLYRIGYYPHNIDFLHYGALMNGESAVAIAEGKKLAYHMLPLQQTASVFFDYYNSAPVVALVRYGKWNDILALPAPDPTYLQTAAVHHYARGIAFLRTGQISEAEAESVKLDSINKLDTLKSIYAFFNATSQITNVASNLLRGEVLLKTGKTDQGLAALRDAVNAEDELRYNEPSDWRLPARHFLGAALLETGKADESVAVYERDLVLNPGNGWSLMGLSKSLEKLGKASDAKVASERFRKAWKTADVAISSSRF